MKRQLVQMWFEGQPAGHAGPELVERLRGHTDLALEARLVLDKGEPAVMLEVLGGNLATKTPETPSVPLFFGAERIGSLTPQTAREIRLYSEAGLGVTTSYQMRGGEVDVRTVSLLPTPARRAPDPADVEQLVAHVLDDPAIAPAVRRALCRFIMDTGHWPEDQKVDRP